MPPLKQSPTVLITGASSGIGAAAAAVFAEANYNVVLAARRLEKLNAISLELQKKYPLQKFVPIECDVSSNESISSLFARVSQEFTELNVLVNNAGYGVYGSVEETSIESFQQNMNTNLLGTIRSTKAALPLLRRAVANATSRWGASIIMVSSIVGRRSMPYLSSYCATKFAMEALSESLRIELWNERIAVSVVNPGVTLTEFGTSAVGSRPPSFLSFERGMSSEAVARVILACAKRPSRNRYLTAAGKVGVFFQWFSPRLFDFVLRTRTSKHST